MIKPYTIQLADRIMLDASRPVDRTAQADCEASACRQSLEDANYYGVYYLNMSEGSLGIITSWYVRDTNFPPAGATLLMKYINGKVWHEPAPPPPLVIDMLTCCRDCSKPPDNFYIQMSSSGSYARGSYAHDNYWKCPHCGLTCGR